MPLSTLVCLGVLAAPAFAAPPETPETGKASAITASSATLEGGVLNPKASSPVEGGEYRYLVNASPTRCEEGFAAPEQPGIAAGLPKEPVSPVKLTGLQANQHYTFCLQETNKAEEAATGPPVTFTTLAIAPTIYLQRAQEEEGEIRLVAEVNANNELTECHFQYGQASISEHEVPCEQETFEGAGARFVGVNLRGVTADAKYQFRAILKNATGTTEGSPEEFTSKPEAQTIAPVAGVVEVGSTTAVLHGVLDAHAKGADKWRFRYKVGGYSCAVESAGEMTQEESGVEAEDLAVSAEVTELQPGTEYKVCVEAFNAEKFQTVGNTISFTTAGASNVGSNSASLAASVNPEGVDTAYFFEYGPTTAYGSRTPAHSVGDGIGAAGALATLEGLSPDTLYHFRAVADSASGERHGRDVSFSTLAVGLLGPPDDRGFEYIPLTTLDGEVVDGSARAAADGSAVSFKGQTPAEGGNGNGANPFEEYGQGGVFSGAGDNQYLADRSAAGWSVADLQPHGLATVQFGPFSGNLSLSIVTSSQPLTEGAPSSEALYSRDSATGSYALLGTLGAGGVAYAGSTPDGTHALISSRAGGLYETGAGAPSPVNVLPEGGTAANAVFGAPTHNGPAGFEPSENLSNVISPDGSRVFWTQTDAAGNPHRLFVTEHAGSAGQRTVQLDASQVGGSGGEGRFETASTDGTRVFFVDCNNLTADSTAVPTPDCERVVEHQLEDRSTPAGSDLYEYNLATGALRDLTVATAGEHADVVGVLGASADGAYVYFAAGGALASGASPQECIEPTPRELGQPYGIHPKCNIYLSHDGGAPQLVATVANAEWSDWATRIGSRASYVASSAGDLVFSAAVNLTGFSTVTRGGGPGRASEIYMFTPGAGVACVSCNPAGALALPPPRSGARLPESQAATYASRDVSADGSRVFFETAEGLVPQDQNGKGDVYEWERSGAGSCTRPAGCLYALSGGASTASSRFLDASETGDDVFFITRGDFGGAGEVQRFKLYDARVGAVQPPAPNACSGTGCQGVPAAPPIFATPSSATFNGVGNYPPPVVVKPKPKTVKCARWKTLKHGKCTKQKKSKKTKAKRASHDRRPSR